MAKLTTFTTPVTAVEIVTSEVTGRQQVRLEQTVTTIYESVAGSGSGNDSLGGEKSIKRSEPFITVRKAWIDELITLEQANAFLASKPNAKIIRRTSCDPAQVMSPGQKKAIVEGFKTEAEILASLEVFNKKDGDQVFYGPEGAQLPVYGRFAFLTNAEGDIDLRAESYNRMMQSELERRNAGASTQSRIPVGEGVPQAQPTPVF